MSVVVIGSGFAGMATAHGLNRLGIANTVLERKGEWGGHTHSLDTDGFWFDEGPHLSFTKDERVRDVFAQGAQNAIEELPARVSNYFQGHWITHPAQVHLFGLDPDLVTRIIADFVEAQNNPKDLVTYADWLEGMYGKTFSEEFPTRYTRKYWTVDPQKLGVDWVGKRMYPPKLEEVVRGALAADNQGDFHYLKSYRYPSHGGYQSFMKALAEGSDVKTDSEVMSVNVADKSVQLANGETVTYDQLVSTMPLDKLVERLTGVDVPAEVIAAAQKLLCTSVVLVDIAVDRADLFDNEWFYIYDEDIIASRVHFPHMLAPSMAPDGKGSIQAEVYFSREMALPGTLDEVRATVVEDFIKMGILRNHDEVLWSRTRVIDYANIVFDHDRQPSLDIIKPFIEKCGIILAGRFGEWDYHWTDDATNAGWNAAARVGDTTVDKMLA